MFSITFPRMNYRAEDDLNVSYSDVGTGFGGEVGDSTRIQSRL